MEMVTDGVLVHVLDEYMTVPMVSAVPRQHLLSKANLGDDYWVIVILLGIWQP